MRLKTLEGHMAANVQCVSPEQELSNPSVQNSPQDMCTRILEVQLCVHKTWITSEPLFASQILAFQFEDGGLSPSKTVLHQIRLMVSRLQKSETPSASNAVN